MNNPKLKYTLSFTFILFCVFSAFCLWSLYNLFREEEKGVTCALVPRGFSKADLLGTWMAKNYMTDSTDTLIFREDGTYKQVIHIKNPVSDYETNWQEWRVEYGKKGIPYLYLQDLRVCAFSAEVTCEWVNDSKISWADCCNDRPSMALRGELVLTIVGPPGYSTPTGSRQDISLILFRGCENSAWSYRFQEP